MRSWSPLTVRYIAGVPAFLDHALRKKKKDSGEDHMRTNVQSSQQLFTRISRGINLNSAKTNKLFIANVQRGKARTSVSFQITVASGVSKPRHGKPMQRLNIYTLDPDLFYRGTSPVLGKYSALEHLESASGSRDPLSRR